MIIIQYLILAFFLIIAILPLLSFWHRRIQSRRESFIDSFKFPPRIHEQLIKTYPHLSPDQANNIIKGLRDYFHLCRAAGPRRMVAMPSQAVDVAWHELILFTKVYENFCQQALGYFLHHTPAEAMNNPTEAQKSIKTAWQLACQRERMPPKRPAYLPLLFAIDAKYDIPDGFFYQLNCLHSDNSHQMNQGSLPNRSTSVSFCASHIGCSSNSRYGCASGCGGIGGDGDSGGCGGCGGGD